MVVVPDFSCIFITCLRDVILYEFETGDAMKICSTRE